MFQWHNILFFISGISEKYSILVPEKNSYIFFSYLEENKKVLQPTSSGFFFYSFYYFSSPRFILRQGYYAISEIQLSLQFEVRFPLLFRMLRTHFFLFLFHKFSPVTGLLPTVTEKKKCSYVSLGHQHSIRRCLWTSSWSL